MSTQHSSPLLYRLGSIVMYVLAALIPLAFFPFSADFFDTPKKAVLFIGGTVLAILWLIKTITQRKVKLTFSPISSATFLFLVSTLVSSLFATPHIQEALLDKGWLIGAVALLVWMAPMISRVNLDIFKRVLFISMGVLGVLTVLQNLGFGPSLLINKFMATNIPNTAVFSLFGVAAMGSLVLALFALGNVIELLSAKNQMQRMIHAALVLITAAAFLFNTYNILPGKPAQLLSMPWQAAWSIGLDTLKTTRTAVIGVGPSSYSSAFTVFRPTSLNVTPLWAARYGNSRSDLLTLLTTQGILGIVTWLILARITWKFARKHMQGNASLWVIVLGILVAQVFMNVGVIALLLSAIIVAALLSSIKAAQPQSMPDAYIGFIASRDDDAPASLTASSIIAPFAAVVVLVGGLGWAHFNTFKALLADSYFARSLITAANNDGTATYALQQKMIGTSPDNDSYLRAFSSTNLLLAESILSKKDITDKDRTNVNQLIQQSVSFAKRATDIDPRKAENWENLAGVYRALIGSVDTADQFTVAAFVRAIQVDPSNPLLRFELANIYGSTNNMDQAIRLLQQAIELKPDWVRPYYFMAKAFEQKGDYQNALAAMLQVQQLLTANSPDRPQFEKELKDLQDKVKMQQDEAQKMKEKAAAATSGKTTQTKGAAGSNTANNGNGAPLLPDGQIRIPENLGLPSANEPVSVPNGPETSPTPSASPKASATPAATPKP